MLKKILLVSVIILSTILLIALIVGLSEFMKIYPTELLLIIIPTMFIVMICVGLGCLIKSKEWSAVICFGYIVTLFLLITWIIYKINLGGLNFVDFGIGFVFLLLSIFTFKRISKFFFWVKAINQPVARVNDAVVKGLNKLGLPIIQNDVSKDQIVIVVYDPNVYEYRGIECARLIRITISIKELAKYSTEIRIRVGVLGNMKRSKQIFEAMEIYLKN